MIPLIYYKLKYIFEIFYNKVYFTFIVGNPISFKRNIWYLWGKNLTKEEIKNYKMTEREIYEKFDNLSKDELNTKSNKNVYIRNNVMTNIIKHCKGKKKEE